MHDSMIKKLDQLQNRINEIQELLVDSKTIEDIERYTLLNKEFSELKPIVEKFEEYKNVIQSIKYANEFMTSEDKDLRILAEDELKNNQDIPEKLEQELKFMLLPKDSADDGSAFLEIRSGAGGDEAPTRAHHRPSHTHHPPNACPASSVGSTARASVTTHRARHSYTYHHRYFQPILGDAGIYEHSSMHDTLLNSAPNTHFPPDA